MNDTKPKAKTAKKKKAVPDIKAINRVNYLGDVYELRSVRANPSGDKISIILNKVV